jgi:hypothetical protein
MKSRRWVMADVVLHGMGHLLVPVNLQRSVNHVSGLFCQGSLRSVPGVLPNPRMQPAGRAGARLRAGGTLRGRAEERWFVCARA